MEAEGAGAGLGFGVGTGSGLSSMSLRLPFQVLPIKQGLAEAGILTDTSVASSKWLFVNVPSGHGMLIEVVVDVGIGAVVVAMGAFGIGLSDLESSRYFPIQHIIP